MKQISKYRIPSAFGAILAAMFVTVISTIPDAVHASEATNTCAAAATACHSPIRY